jgi:hypothetical protein
MRSALKEFNLLISELICCYLTIQKFDLGIANCGQGLGRFCVLNSIPITLNNNQIETYYNKVETALKFKNNSLKLKSEIKNFKRLFKELKDALSFIPGKYLLEFIKARIVFIFKINQMAFESFTYRIAKNCNLDDLQFLKKSITEYIT